MTATRPLLFSAILTVVSIGGYAQAIQPVSTFRIYPADQQRHIQSLSQDGDTAWALVRDYRNRTNAVIRISWNGAVYPVDFNLSGDYVSICANPGGGYWLTKLDGTLEEWDEGGLKKRQWRTPASSGYQVRTGKLLVTVNRDAFLLTDVENGRSRAMPFAEGWSGENINAFDRLSGNEVAVYSGVRGAFLKLNTDSDSQEITAFTAEALEAGRAIYRGLVQAAGVPTYPDGTKTQPPVTVLMPGIAADGAGKIFAMVAPMKIAAASVVQFTGDGAREREYALDLRSAPGQDSMMPTRLLVKDRSLMLFSANGLAQVFNLPQ